MTLHFVAAGWNGAHLRLHACRGCCTCVRKPEIGDSCGRMSLMVLSRSGHALQRPTNFTGPYTFNCPPFNSAAYVTIQRNNPPVFNTEYVVGKTCELWSVTA